MTSRAARSEGVALDDGDVIEFQRTSYGAIVGGTICDRADAIRLADDLREACDDAQRHLGVTAA